MTPPDGSMYGTLAHPSVRVLQYSKITGLDDERRQLRILHVVEGLASGVLSALDLLATEQERNGARVAVLYTRSMDTPPEAVLDAHFPAAVARMEVRVPRGVPRGAALAKALSQARPGQYDVVHAHSSWAGLVVRATALDHRRWRHIWYTPHAYGFLRTDTSRLARQSIISVERRLSRVGSVAAVSHSEAGMARRVACAPRVHVLANRIRIETLPNRSASQSAGMRPRVVSVGRVVAQKDPARFRGIASALSDVADFVWVGATGRDVAPIFGGSTVKTVPWTSRQLTLEEMAHSDVYLSTSRWEGLPLALVEAQAIGLPAVCTDVPGNCDVVQPGISGYLEGTDSAIIERLRRLLTDQNLSQRMSMAARRSAADRFAAGSLGAESLSLYTKALSSR